MTIGVTKPLHEMTRQDVTDWHTLLHGMHTHAITGKAESVLASDPALKRDLEGHRKYIHAAHKEGKHIPDDVLADYPELKKKKSKVSQHSEEKKPVHELSREEFFNDLDHVRSTMPSKHQIHFKYPVGNGQFKKHNYTSDTSMKKGESVKFGTVRGATVTASREFKPNYNNLEMFEHGKKHHKEAVETAHAAGKPISPHVLKDYPHLSSQHSEDRKGLITVMNHDLIAPHIEQYGGKLGEIKNHVRHFTIPSKSVKNMHIGMKSRGWKEGKHYHMDDSEVYKSSQHSEETLQFEELVNQGLLAQFNRKY